MSKNLRFLILRVSKSAARFPWFKQKYSQDSHNSLVIRLPDILRLRRLERRLFFETLRTNIQEYKLRYIVLSNDRCTATSINSYDRPPIGRPTMPSKWHPSLVPSNLRPDSMARTKAKRKLLCRLIHCLFALNKIIFPIFICMHHLACY